jgi:iron complex outermembrane recepter protein
MAQPVTREKTKLGSIFMAINSHSASGNVAENVIIRRFVSAILATSALAALTFSVPAVAQQAPAEASSELQEITVTGSMLKRLDFDTPAPVQVISSEDIAKLGYTSISDVLHALTANGQGNLNQGFSGAFAAGASGVSLRGMTVDATLVLVDGHRMANYPISDDGQRSFVDVANLPESAIERVEVLKDGASAIYGSDAIAGVVNIILKKNFTGAEVLGEYGTSYNGDANTAHFSATAGMGDLNSDGHNTYINLEYRHQDPLGLDARPPFNNFDYQSVFGPAAPVPFGVVQQGQAFPFIPTLNGMVGQYDPANPANPTNFQNLPGCKTPDPRGGCAYDQAAYYEIQPRTENINILIRHSVKFDDNWTGTFTGSMFESKADQLNPPSNTIAAFASLNGAVNTTDPTAQPVLLPIGNVNNPFPNNPAWLAYTFGDVGATRTESDTRMFRFVADLNGSAAGWDFAASVGAMRGLANLSYFNYVTVSGLDKVLADNSYHLGANAGLNAPSVYQTLAPTTHELATSQLQYLEVNGSRTLFELAGGPLSFGLGAGLRHSGQQDPGQPDTINADVFGLGTTFISGTENNENMHAEFNAPLLKSLELDGAYRWDNYGGIGSKGVPKVGLIWKPITQLSLRGTYAKGFRVPGPGERGNSGVTFFLSEGTDNTRCPTTGLPSDCGQGAIAGAVSGNPHLSPETSDSYSLGFVLSPWVHTSLSVDWWKVKRKNEILADFSNPIIVRGPVQSKYPTIPGPEIEIEGPYQNLGVDEPTGVDFDLKSRWDAGTGEMGLNLSYTHLISQKICGTSNPASCSYVDGTHGPTGISGDTGTPRNRILATLDYTLAAVNFGTTMNYVSGYKNTDPSADGPACLNAWWTPCYVSSFTDFDVFGSYILNKHLNINLHVLNVGNAHAPFDPQAAYSTRNYNNAFAQQGAIGRFFQVGAKYTF